MVTFTTIQLHEAIPLRDCQELCASTDLICLHPKCSDFESDDTCFVSGLQTQEQNYPPKEEVFETNIPRTCELIQVGTLHNGVGLI